MIKSCSALFYYLAESDPKSNYGQPKKNLPLREKTNILPYAVKKYNPALFDQMQLKAHSLEEVKDAQVGDEGGNSVKKYVTFFSKEPDVDRYRAVPSSYDPPDYVKDLMEKDTSLKNLLKSGTITIFKIEDSNHSRHFKKSGNAKPNKEGRASSYLRKFASYSRLMSKREKPKRKNTFHKDRFVAIKELFPTLFDNMKKDNEHEILEPETLDPMQFLEISILDEQNCETETKMNTLKISQESLYSQKSKITHSTRLTASAKTYGNLSNSNELNPIKKTSSQANATENKCYPTQNKLSTITFAPRVLPARLKLLNPGINSQNFNQSHMVS